MPASPVSVRWISGQKNVRHSKDVISFARKRGYFNGKDENSALPTLTANMMRNAPRLRRPRMELFPPLQTKMDKYFAWVNADSDVPMPLYSIPRQESLACRGYGTRCATCFGVLLDMTQDGRAPVPSTCLPAWRPMEYGQAAKKCKGIRAIATQQTGWARQPEPRLVARSRRRCCSLFGTDDATTPLFICALLYVGMTEVPPGTFAKGDINTLSLESNF